MQSQRSTTQEAAEDVFFGQLVIIYARWFVIVSMVILALWTSTTINQLIGAVIIIVPLMAINFFVHGRYLMEKPVNRLLLTVLSGVDLVAVTLLIMFWPAEKGAFNQFYILYYPLILAYAFVSTPRASLLYTLAALLLYTAACFAVDPAILMDSEWLERITLRLITLAAMGVLGAYYWRSQRSRMRQAVGPEPELA